MSDKQSENTDLPLSPNKPSLKEKMKRNGGIILVMAVLLSAGGGFIYNDFKNRPGTSKVANSSCIGNVGLQKGDCVPNFKLTTLNNFQQNISNAKISLDDLEAKPTFLYFFNTWCGICHSHMPELSKLIKKYRDKINFVFINDFSSETSLSDLVSFVGEAFAEHGKDRGNFVFVGDKDIKASFNIYGVPKNIILDKEHKILLNKDGAMPINFLERYLDNLVS